MNIAIISYDFDWISNYVSENHSQINTPDRKGRYPINIAIRMGNKRRFNRRDNPWRIRSGYHPSYGINETKNIEMVKFLVELGVDINVIDKKGYSPIDYACKYGKIRIMKYLIENGVKMGTKTLELSILHKCKRMRSMMCFYLIQNNVPIIPYHLTVCVMWYRTDILSAIVEKIHMDGIPFEISDEDLLTSICSIKNSHFFTIKKYLERISSLSVFKFSQYYNQNRIRLIDLSYKKYLLQLNKMGFFYDNKRIINIFDYDGIYPFPLEAQNNSILLNLLEDSEDNISRKMKDKIHMILYERCFMDKKTIAKLLDMKIPSFLRDKLMLSYSPVEIKIFPPEINFKIGLFLC